MKNLFKSALFIILIAQIVIIEAHKFDNIGYQIRKATMDDEENVKLLYRKVASTPGGLIRTSEEITDDYIHQILCDGIYKGLFLVVTYQEKIIGSMVKMRLNLSACTHILTNGSILIDPEYQGKGIGTQLILKFLQEVQDNFQDILRVEITARISNPAIKLYERLGFQHEGRYEQSIKALSGKLFSGVSMVWFNPNYKSIEK